MSRWHAIWASRAGQGEALEDLIRLDGFDQGAGHANVGAWRAYCQALAQRLPLAGGASIFEVGCGAGALLRVFHEAGHPVGGIDFSPALIDVARRAMPGRPFAVAEASRWSAPVHDVVLANSVFSYFPDLDYAAGVVRRMLAHARQAVAILDVPDAARREASEAYRRGALAPGEYEQRYAGLAHLYYPREWFQGQGGADWRVETVDQWMEDYGNAPFRFNVLFRRAA